MPPNAVSLAAVDTRTVRAHLAAANQRPTPGATAACVADCRRLVDQVDLLTTEIAALRAEMTARLMRAELTIHALEQVRTLEVVEHNRLRAHARAAVAADDSGWPEPLHLVRDYLAETGQLPAAGAEPMRILSDTAHTPKAA